MVKKKSGRVKGKNAALKKSTSPSRKRTVQGEYQVPYFKFETNGKGAAYDGVFAVVTDDFGEIRNGLETLNVPQLVDKGRCEMMYRNPSHYEYDIALVAVKEGQRRVVEKVIGEFLENGPYNTAWLMPQDQKHRFGGFDNLSKNDQEKVGGIVALVQNSPEEYLITRRQAV